MLSFDVLSFIFFFVSIEIYFQINKIPVRLFAVSTEQYLQIANVEMRIIVNEDEETTQIHF